MSKFITRDSGEREIYATGMIRDVEGSKPRYDLVYKPLLKRWAELMTRGALKYGPRNWEKAATQQELDRFKESANRHFEQWMADERDEDHAAATLFNIGGALYVENKVYGVCKCKDERGCKNVGTGMWVCSVCDTVIDLGMDNE